MEIPEHPYLWTSISTNLPIAIAEPSARRKRCLPVAKSGIGQPFELSSVGPTKETSMGLWTSMLSGWLSPTPEKDYIEFVSWDSFIPNIWKNSPVMFQSPPTSFVTIVDAFINPELWFWSRSSSFFSCVQTIWNIPEIQFLTRCPMQGRFLRWSTTILSRTSWGHEKQRKIMT